MTLTKTSLRHLLLSAMFLAILVVQEQLLVMLPNIQLTTALIMIYATILPAPLLGLLVFSYVILDSLITGTFNLFYMIPMLFGWLLLAFVARMIRNRSLFVILLVALGFGFVYGWIYIPFQMIQFGINIAWPYLVADLPFEISMAVSNFFSVLLLYPLLSGLLKQLDAHRQAEE